MTDYINNKAATNTPAYYNFWRRPSTAKEESTDRLESVLDTWGEDECYTFSQRGTLALHEFTQGICKKKKKKRKRNVLHNTQL